jgi:TfoX/Sxy family transcriptional regulator of competence genes
MAYDETLAHRVRHALSGQTGIAEKKMFGGLTFMLQGNMCCGVVGETLMLRVGPDKYEDALGQPHARPMDFSGKPMRGMVYVDPAGIETDAYLHTWVGRAVDFALSLPAK